jgi:5-methylcytosine-specific restriction endonuclease McrA
MPSNPRTRNGAKYRRLRTQLLATEDRCSICGGHIDKSLKTPHPLSAELEHVVPLSCGGAAYRRENLAIAHRRCNRFKSNKVLGSPRGTDANNGNDHGTASGPQPTSREW